MKFSRVMAERVNQYEIVYVWEDVDGSPFFLVDESVSKEFGRLVAPVLPWLVLPTVSVYIDHGVEKRVWVRDDLEYAEVN